MRIHLFSSIALARAAVLIVAACSGSEKTTFTVATSDAPPAYGTTPFPTDGLREGDHLAVISGLDTLLGQHADLIAAHVAALDGYGLRPLVEFFASGPLDVPPTFEHTSALTDPAVVVDVDPASPERGRVIAMNWRYDTDRNVLAGVLASGELLREGTRYAAFVTTDVAPRSSGMDKLAHSSAARWQSTADAIRELDRSDIAALTVFTTQHATAPMLAARDVIDALPVSTLAFPDPTLTFTGTTELDAVLGQATRATEGPRTGLERWGGDNRTGLAHDHIGVMKTGAMTVVRLRRDDLGTNGPDDETFANPPSVRSMDTIPVTFILPATPPPPAGYPIVIFGHGGGQSRDQLPILAEPLNAQGFAVVGIDMVGHGSRYDAVDSRPNPAFKLAAFSGNPTKPDGFGDTTGTATLFDFFEGFFNMSAVRDSLRQSALDLHSLTRMLRHGDLSALGATLDPSHIAYIGDSFGSIIGTGFAAIEPDIDLFILNVPGAGILDISFPGSAELGSLVLPLVQGTYRPRLPFDRWNPVLGLLQAVLDGADPLSYATHIMSDRFASVGPRSVVCIEVVGDQSLPNEGTAYLARELGMDVLEPYLTLPAGLTSLPSPASANRDGHTAILVQYSPASHGLNLLGERARLVFLPGFPQPGDDPFPKLPAPITFPGPIYETYAQIAEILVSHLTGAPVVRSTLAPVADFDGDGRPDASDPAPYDPTH